MDTYADMQMKPSIQMCQNNITTQDTRRTLQVQYIVLAFSFGFGLLYDHDGAVRVVRAVVADAPQQRLRTAP